MIIKTIQWNIGGGKLLRKDANPTLLSSYTEDGLEKIIDFLREQNSDIITLQETHAASGHSQPEILAQALGYKYWTNDEYADSHIEEGQRLGQGIVSRFPITNHEFDMFVNPQFEAVWEDGTIAKSHDKGRTKCEIEIKKEQSIVVQTFHTIPFRRFNIAINSDEAKNVLSDMSAKLLTKEPGIIQADFNVNAQSLRELFPRLFEVGFHEIVQSQPTTVKSHYYDHILYSKLRVLDNSTIKGVTTDHYPLVTMFEIGN